MIPAPQLATNPTAPSPSRKGGKRVLFGWQGISAKVPSDWSLGAIGGEFKSGYLRLDDADRPRLEVKWSAGAVDLDKALDKYLRSLKKPRRGREISTEVDAHLLAQRARPKKSLRSFRWEAENQAWGVIWSCQVCGRTVVAQVLGRPGEDLAPRAREVLLSLEDHGAEGELTWAVYGLVCRVPEGYALEKHKLMSGYLQLDFAQGHRKLKVSRLGLARLLLGERTLRDWLELENIKRRDVSWEASDLELHGHPAAQLRGHRRRLGHRLRRATEKLLQLGPPVDFALQAWACPDSNRIYLVESFHHGEPDVLRRVVNSIPCHTQLQ